MSQFQSHGKMPDPDSEVGMPENAVSSSKTVRGLSPSQPPIICDKFVPSEQDKEYRFIHRICVNTDLEIPIKCEDCKIKREMGRENNE